ncbi:NAD(P)H-dependent oxidoreductase [Streptosporangium canum]|uniref:NAD(P)H-dependent oxidoreductase n=1 Tax=Streptosporangium canum TaxID=324952 RepID=UPI0037ABC138
MLVLEKLIPVWRFGLPAILKGWIDRVWNQGLTYGRSLPRMRGKRMLRRSLISYTREEFAGPG